MNELATTTNGLQVIEPGPADRNPALVYLAGLAPGSRRTMRGALDTIAAILGAENARGIPWHDLRFQHTAAIRAELAERYGHATVNKMLSALRGTLKAAWQLGQMPAEEYFRAAGVGNVRGETLPAGRALSSGELQALMAACANDPTPAGARDAAIVALLYSCGLRRAELVTLDLDDHDPATGALRIQGKGGKQRFTYAVNGAADALADWLRVRGDDPGALFWAINKGGRLIAGGMTSQAIYNVLRKRAIEAGVADFSPHDLRRSFVGDLLDAGADISTVQRLAGHASVQTTARYDRRPEATKLAAASLLHVPYRRRML